MWLEDLHLLSALITALVVITIYAFWNRTAARVDATSDRQIRDKRASLLNRLEAEMHTAKKDANQKSSPLTTPLQRRRLSPRPSANPGGGRHRFGGDRRRAGGG